MTTNERPEQRKGSAPDQPADQPADLPGPLRGASAGPTGWLDARTAEQLLDAGPDASHDDPRAADLARLLASAVEEADSLPAGTNGEQLALQAFRDARRRARTPAGPGCRRARWRRASRPTKVLVGGIAAVSVLSGVAIAATTGTLPGPFRTGGGTPAESRSASAASPSAGASGAAGPQRPVPDPSATAPTASRPASTHPAAPGESTAAQPGLKGLCTSYLRAPQRGEHLDATAQRRLDAAAGGAAKVASYCAQLTGEHTPGRGRPTTAASPTAASPAAAAPSASSPQTATPRAARPATPAAAASPTTSHGHA
ncbi:hypothetical protein [Actinacidiphila sp. bgisy145]|uniref:hypothetical protein n=1 Tax=Actinacidiphila sp. bgisy145 TaxID=3413792 RepID=UPI003EBE77C7